MGQPCGEGGATQAADSSEPWPRQVCLTMTRTATATRTVRPGAPSSVACCPVLPAAWRQEGLHVRVKVQKGTCMKRHNCLTLQHPSCMMGEVYGMRAGHRHLRR